MSGLASKSRKVAKPPYRVPSMAGVAGTAPNGLKVVSTFSGCGGSCLGFRMAGFETIWASEFIPAARDTYLANFPDVPVDPRDIRMVEPEEVLRAIDLKAGEVDVMEGSPPCAGFSMAGKRDESWGKIRSYSDGAQRIDDLFFEYARLIQGIRPKVFVAENVAGLVRGVSKGYFKEILAELSKGYRVKAKVLDAQWLGVPQTRERLIFMGVREDLPADPVFPTPWPYRYTIADALPWIKDTINRHGPHFTWKRAEPVTDPLPTLMTHTEDQIAFVDAGSYPDVILDTAYPNKEPRVFDVDNVPISTIQAQSGWDHFGLRGGVPTELPGVDPEDLHVLTASPRLREKWMALRVGEQDPKRFNLIRSDPDRPAHTVCYTHGMGRGVHHAMPPYEPRKFTILELKRLCGFPDDYKLTGNYQQRWERLGRAVPPLMMRAVAETIRDKVLSACAG